MSRSFCTANYLNVEDAGTTSSFGCFISCKLGCGCKRNVGSLGLC
uniref:Uncharacterized protein n=1 Tax=Utricularia reniformis TaxID=192314 RepID=A0A1Y0B0Q0_9LAMI|nr:hypothetical protein AEK19_MT0723 [Utricularia reniformis]ART30969.1 hypothetical protein AEK19_MT0723 [Utricularia reniformis]